MKSPVIGTCCLAILYFSFATCDRNFSSNDGIDDPFIEEIKTSLPEVATEIKPLPVSVPVHAPRRILTPGTCHKDPLIVTEHADDTILLLSRNGELLFRAGGEGRGPGEFESLMRSHIGADGRLYVIDGLQFRISVYEIGAQILDLEATISYKNPPSHFLADVYVTENGIYGVYEESEGFRTPENRYLLYLLDENFVPVKQLLELPGDERQKIELSGRTFYAPYPYRSKTVWDADGEWFYYLATVESSVHLYNLRTGRKTKRSFFQFGERFNSREFIDAVKTAAPEGTDDYWKPLEHIPTLPLFSGMYADGDRIYRPVRSVPGDEGVTLITDRRSGETHYFTTSRDFSISSVCGDAIYGIDFKPDGEHRPMVVQLRW